MLTDRDREAMRKRVRALRFEADWLAMLLGWDDAQRDVRAFARRMAVVSRRLGPALVAAARELGGDDA